MLFVSIVPQSMTPVDAASSDQIKDQIESIEQEQAKLENMVANLESQKMDNASAIQEMMAQKAILDQQASALSEQIRLVDEKIITQSLLIADKQVEVDEANARFDILCEQNKKRIRAMEESGGISYWSVLFKANSFSDLLDRAVMIQEIARADQRCMDQLADAINDVANAKADLEKEMAALDAHKQELEALEADLSKKRQESAKILQELIAKGQEFEDYIHQAENDLLQLEEELASAEIAYDEAKRQEYLDYINSQLNNSNKNESDQDDDKHDSSAANKNESEKNESNNKPNNSNADKNDSDKNDNKSDSSNSDKNESNNNDDKPSNSNNDKDEESSNNKPSDEDQNSSDAAKPEKEDDTSQDKDQNEDKSESQGDKDDYKNDNDKPSSGGSETGSDEVKWLTPCSYGRVSSAFGYRMHPVYNEWRMHNGVDLTGKCPTKIVATRSGVVVVSGWNNSAGYYVKIDHLDGYSSVYMHLCKTPEVKVGDIVIAGDKIGCMGTTGASTGVHLHFGIQYKGAYVDPMKYIG
jgi:murein DD-endopeptidase MepM/ murein hydrolase activator NlpD